MQPEKGQYPRLSREWLALALLVVTAMLTAVGPVSAEKVSSSRDRIEPSVGATIVQGPRSHTRPNIENPSGSDATRLAGDGQPATPLPTAPHPPVTIAGVFSGRAL